MGAAWKHLAATLLIVGASSCGLIAGVPSIADGGKGGDAAQTTCKEDADCLDADPCTVDTCGLDKLCVRSPYPDGAPAALQTAGDCSQVTCTAGKVSIEPDGTDVPDDKEDCTVDACSGAVAEHTPKAKDTPCTDASGNAGLCDEAGKCTVQCTVASDCTSPSSCQTPSCAQGACVLTPVPDGPLPPSAQTDGDCHTVQCVGGKQENVVDDADVPLTPANDCDLEVCTGGVKSNPPRPIHDPCSTFGGGMAGFCDGNGTCQQCAADLDCPGTTDDCQHPACDLTTFTCVTAYTAAMTPTTTNPQQVVGDCAQRVCDGAGNAVLVLDGSDPTNDMNACTTDTCTAIESTIHPSLADGTPCGVNLACSGGQCVGCLTSSNCPPATCTGTVLTKAQTCSASAQCVAPSPPTQQCAPYLCVPTGCTTSCTNDAGCSQAGTGNYCSSGACLAKLAAGLTCGASNQCQSGFCVDGVCCNTACTGACMACSTAKKGSGASGTCGAVANGTDPDNECPDDGVASCDRDGVCNGAGACRLYASGTVCAATSCSGSVLTSAGTCDGSGTCSAVAAPCAGGYACASSTTCGATCGFIAGPSGDARCASSHYCNGGISGACLPKLGFGVSCNRNGECLSNDCMMTCQ